MSLLHPSAANAPHLERLVPRAAIPGGTLALHGTHLLAATAAEGHALLGHAPLPYATFGETTASLDMARDRLVIVRVPEGAIASDLTLHRDGQTSNVVHANVGVPMAEGLHVISNPVADADGNLFAMFSGPRGERVPVSIFRIDRDLQVRPFVRDMLNVSALALDRAGYLYAQRGWHSTQRAICLSATARERFSRSARTRKFLCSRRWSLRWRRITWRSPRMEPCW
jgi:hypothetical protein